MNIYLCDLVCDYTDPEYEKMIAAHDTVKRDNLVFSPSACYNNWYKKTSQNVDKNGGILLVLLDSIKPVGKKISEGQYNTVMDFVGWARGLGMGIRFTECAHSSIPELEPEEYDMVFYDLYALEISYDINTIYTAKLYMYLCHMRFMTAEFLRCGLPENYSYRKLLSGSFYDIHGYSCLHFPVNGGIHPNPFTMESKPDTERFFLGRAFYDFCTEILKNNSLKGIKNRDRLYSGISRNVWTDFYENWYVSCETKSLDY